MPEEQAGDLPGELDSWLSDRAASTGRDRDAELARAVATYRLLSKGEEAVRSNGEVTSLDERLDALARRVEALDEETDKKIEDVRDRVVQVLHTAQEKADSGHDHPDLADRVDRAERTAAEAGEAVQGLREDLEDLQERVDGGFENYESILESLTDRADELDVKTTTLASVFVDARRSLAELERESARRSAAEDLQETANRKGIETADCGSCNSTIRLGLLSEPRCPHCAGVFDGVESASGFLGSATLTVGDRPALSGRAVDDETPDEPADLFDDE